MVLAALLTPSASSHRVLIVGVASVCLPASPVHREILGDLDLSRGLVSRDSGAPRAPFLPILSLPA
eukprot:1411204-Heterocapsa_arctica.AAC.1